MKKKPPSRLQWLQKALLFAGHKDYPVDTLYDFITNPKFSLLGDDVEEHGAEMWHMIKHSLHLFQSPQRDFLTSTSFALYRDEDEDTGRSVSSQPREDRASPSGRREREGSVSESRKRRRREHESPKRKRRKDSKKKKRKRSRRRSKSND